MNPLLSNEQVENIAKLTSLFPGEEMTKYCDAEVMIEEAWLRAKRLGLTAQSPYSDPPAEINALKIVDLGGGFGYFAYLARAMGYDAVVLDRDTAIHREACRILRVPFIGHEIRYRQPLPIKEPCHIITQFRVNLKHANGARWRWREYDWYMYEVISHLERGGGRWHIDPNRGLGEDFVLDFAEWARRLPVNAIVESRCRGQWITLQRAA